MDGRIQDERILKLELRLAQLEKNEECQNTFLSFVKNIWPSFIQGRHHEIISEKLVDTNNVKSTPMVNPTYTIFLATNFP